jgi:taurine dioxygenase
MEERPRMGITVTKLSDAIGAEVSGVDLSRPLDEATVADIRRAWLDNVILVFRGQQVSDDDQERFCRYLGELEVVRSAKAADSAHPSVLLITNVRDTGRTTALEDGEMMFHYDQCYYEHPAMGSTLFAMEVPETGGNTLFASCYAAYDSLDDAMKRRLEGLRALNYYDYARDPTVRPKSLNPDAPQWTHPVVRTHPETGRKALFVNRLMTIRIEGMAADESDALLEALFDRIEDPAHRYEHVWRAGDMVIWDNRCSVHARTYFSPNDRRMMRRVTIRETQPVV